MTNGMIYFEDFEKSSLFIKNTFISNARIKSAKNQANTKQQEPEDELLLFESIHIIHILDSRYHPKKMLQKTHILF